MKKGLIAAAVILSILFVASAQAEEPGRTVAKQAEEPELTDAERELAIQLKGEKAATIAAFDHIERTWTVLAWNGEALKRIDGPTESPDISLGRGKRLRTFIINTNPLVFTADRSATAEADIAALAMLQRLAAGLGGIVNATLAARATDEAVASLAPATTDQPPSLDDIVDYYVAALSANTFETGPINEIEKAAGTLGTQVEAAKEEGILAWLQGIESKMATRPPAPSEVDLDKLAESFTNLSGARENVVAVPFVCETSIATVSEVTRIKLTPISGGAGPEQLDAYRTLAAAMATGLDKQKCPEPLQRATRALSDWFLMPGHFPNANPVPANDRKSLEILLAEVGKVLDIAEPRNRALVAAKELLATQPAATLAVARLNLFHTRLASQAAGVDLTRGVIEVPRSSFDSSAFGWSKKRTDTVKVSVDPSLDGKLTLRHPDTAEGSFTVHHRWADPLELDFAVIDTDLYSPTYEAQDADGVDGGPTKPVETNRSTRSGKVAVMAAYRFLRAGDDFAFGPQVGVGVDTDDASLFYGLSARWWFLSVGWGKTRQKVTELVSKPGADGTLPVGEALRTRDKFDDDHDYWSFAISITELPFFKPKE